MTHLEFLRSLDPAARAALTRRSDLRGLLHLAGHLALIGCLATWVLAGWPAWWVALIPLGIVIVFLFTLEHETVHDTPFATPVLNRIVGTVCGAVVIVPYTWFRYFHLAHHRHTNDPDADPELAGGKPETLWQLLWHVSGVPLWSAMLATLGRHARGVVEEAYIPASRHRRVIREARALIALYAGAGLACLSGQSWIFWGWLLPIVLGQPALRLYLMAEHGRCPAVADMFANTRTTYTAGLLRFIAWNMPYHAEHHTYPSVPFWQLPRLNALLRDHLKSTSNGYVAFHRHNVAALRGRSR